MQIRHLFLSFLFSASFFLFLIFFLNANFFGTVFAQELPTFIFLRDLSVGDTGNDVVELQKILNTDPATKISDVGPGSIGNETSYFGEATKNSVIRFQNKYADEVLRPLGLTSGTGRVGLWSRLKL